jgi:hypothetical protein
VKSNLSLMLVLVAPVLAQSTVKDALTKHWKTSADFSIAVANTMPAESYNFRPNPEEMSFGQLMAHIAGINEYACAIVSGLPRPELMMKNGYRWSGGLQVDQARRLNELEQERAKLKRLVSKLSLEKVVLKDIAAEPSCQH